ncbi:MAG: alpha/beta hydrolase [Burkholderiales bacterium]|nr:alpha/beta hydrolase [Burkholderiales bacterium]
MRFLVQQQPAYVYTGGKKFDASKPSVLFIHGTANDHSVWTLQARYFAHHGWNALAPDLPGHGKSFGDAKVSIAANTDWLMNLLDNGNIASAALVGHSMGSLVALDATARYRSRVSQIALIGASVPMPVSDTLMDAALNRPNDAMDMLNIWGHAPQLKWGRNATPGTSTMMAGARSLAQSRPGVMAKDLTACRAFEMDDATLAAIAIPILIVAGSNDLLTPAKAAKALAARLANVTMITLPEAGHSMMQEAPGKVLDALKGFLLP